MNTSVTQDLGPLSWVKGEIDQALAHSAAACAAAGHAQDATACADQLQAAHTHLHQVQGALAIVGLQGINSFTATLETLLGALVRSAQTEAWLPDSEQLALLQRALAAISHYLDELLAGLPDQALRLLPLYLELEAFKAQSKLELNPVDLFFPDIQQRPPRRLQEPAELAAEARATRLKAARLGFQRGMLKWLKAEAKGLTEMRNSLGVIELTQTQPAARACWWIAQAFLDTLLLDAVPQNVATRKLCARLDSQIGKLLEGQLSVPERLLRELLYYVATATASNEHIDCVRAAYQLSALLPVSETAAVVPHVHLKQMRDALATAKHEWGRASSQLAAARSGFQEATENLAAQGHALGQLDLARLTGNLNAVAQMLLQRTERTIDDTLALEVATALLLTDNALVNFERLGVDFAHQVDVMCSRLNALLRDESPTALAELALPQLDEMTRQAEERLLMQQVTSEILVSLARVEQQLDQYFRNPLVEPIATAAALRELAAPLKQIAGALTVLGEVEAVHLVHSCGQQIAGFAELAEQQQAPAAELCESLAHKLSALNFFVEQLRHGTANLAALLAPPAVGKLTETTTTAATETLETAGLAEPEYVQTSPALGEIAQKVDMTRTALDALRDRPEDQGLRAAVREHFESLNALQEDSDPATAALQLPAADVLKPLQSAVPVLAEADIAQLDAALDEVGASLRPLPVSAETARLAQTAGPELDAELLAIFLEEAEEVLSTLDSQLPNLQAADPDALRIVRRAFHTLKGSGRMVGLDELGEAAWSVEQVLNGWLQEDRVINADLLTMLENAQALFKAWVAALAAAETLPATDTVAALHAACVQLLKPEAPVQVDSEMPVQSMLAVQAASTAEADISPAANFVSEPAAKIAEEQAEAASSAEAPAEIQLGDWRLSAAMLAIYLAEAETHLQVLETACPQWPGQVPAEPVIRASHTLGGSSGALGLFTVRQLAKALEAALEALQQARQPVDERQWGLLQQTVAALRSQQTALQAHDWPEIDELLLKALHDLADVQTKVESDEPGVPASPAALEEPKDASAQAAPEAAVRMEDFSASASTPPQADDQVLMDAAPETPERRQSLRIQDDVDAQLLPIFLEEGRDLLQEIGSELRAWRQHPTEAAISVQLQRLLHTLKGSARMCGAMRLGELVHGIESHLIQATQQEAQASSSLLEALESDFDRAQALFDELLNPAAVESSGRDQVLTPVASDPEKLIVSATALIEAEPQDSETSVSEHRAQLRVRAELVDHLINDAGEMAIARSRIESEMRALKVSLNDLSENVSRLRQQLREIEIQAESQMQSQLSQLQEVSQDFDPLEMDRFTRFQELTRMMAEGVNDVTTVQQNLARTIDQANLALTAQARFNRELSQSLMSVRMLPFNAIINRLYRVVRQTAKEHGKRVNLDVRNGQLELDRSVLDKMVGAIEHLLRNSVVHGIEPPEVRLATGKAEIGEILLSLTQQANEIIIELHDDGAGLDYARIADKARQLGLLTADADVSALEENRLAQFIFAPGFSTATELTSAAGRGVGMDAVKNETENLGGRIDVQSQTGQGVRLRIFLPLTLAVTQVLLVRSGNRTYALPSSMVEQVMELRAEAAAKIREEAETRWLDVRYPWCYLPQLLGESRAAPAPARRHWILLLKGADNHIALEVDGVGGNQEVAVKNIGPQLARVPGMTGATVLADGEIVLILNPLVLAEREQQSLSATRTWAEAIGSQAADNEQSQPAVMVVDDSLTVRKILSRLLQREGYRVLLAKDGVDALEQLNDVVPAAMLVDIEMPRMDGFELTRNLRKDARLATVPIIMITSRIADKHRNHALELGVNEYLGKPYDEAQLLALLRQYTSQCSG